jgi:hypothetical protein
MTKISSARLTRRTGRAEQAQRSFALPLPHTRRSRWRSACVIPLALIILLAAMDSLAEDTATALKRTPAPRDAGVEILSPSDGATVTSPVLVQFGLSGMGVAPAGVERDNTGHHHLIIDAGLPNLQMPIPSDDNYRHFGGGQTQVSVALEPGVHTLQILLGDFRHIPHQPPIASKQIIVNVVAKNGDEAKP